MQWVGYAELASAVSNAGGLGIVCTLCMGLHEVRTLSETSKLLTLRIAHGPHATHT